MAKIEVTEDHHQLHDEIKELVISYLDRMSPAEAMAIMGQFLGVLYETSKRTGDVGTMTIPDARQLILINMDVGILTTQRDLSGDLN